MTQPGECGGAERRQRRVGVNMASAVWAVGWGSAAADAGTGQPSRRRTPAAEGRVMQAERAASGRALPWIWDDVTEQVQWWGAACRGQRGMASRIGASVVDATTKPDNP
ncbi:unnamed protein product [Urochloa humidicola]